MSTEKYKQQSVGSVGRKKSYFIILEDASGRGLVRIPPNSRNYKTKDGKVVSKKCEKCSKFKEVEMFRVWEYSWGRGYAKKCAECLAEQLSVWENRRYVQTIRDKDGILKYKCARCQQFRYPDEFVRENRNKYSGGKSYRCKECHRLYKQQHNKKEEQHGTAV